MTWGEALERRRLLSGPAAVEPPPGSDAEIVIAGDLRPGHSPGVANFEGDVVFSATARLEIEIGGTLAGTQHDVVNVGGRVTAGGTLHVVLLDGFVPQAGDRFQVLTCGSREGDFARYSGLDLPNGLRLRPQFSDTALTLVALPMAQVVGRRVFYNDSAFDGRNPAANSADDAAIATDKQALLPGQPATFANITGYGRGINGVMVDVLNLGGMASAEDFGLRAGGAAGATPSSITVRSGGGTGGSDRVTLTWPDGAVRNGWLEVTMRPTLRNGLAAADAFQFGNLVAEAGDSVGPARVTAADLLATRAGVSPGPVDVTDRRDHDRDRRVNARDLAIVRSNLGRSLPSPPAPAVASTTPRPLRSSDLALVLCGRPAVCWPRRSAGYFATDHAVCWSS